MRGARLRGWTRALFDTFASVGATPARLGLGLTLALFLSQNAQVLYYVSLNADSRAIVRAFDDDAGNAIDVTGRSRWVTDNGFASYGPVYFRVASTIATWFRPVAQPGDLPPDEARTKADHFGLMVTSAAAIAALALLFAALLTREWWFLLLLATLFEWALLRAPDWQYLILKAHPDHLLGLIVAVACYFSARGWRDPERVTHHRLAAWAWGIALATKASVILFTPFVGLAFLYTQTRERVVKGLRYVGHVTLAYFLVGFPQNFNLPRLYRFLVYQSGYSKSATADSVREWFTLWGAQVVAPLVVAVVTLILLRPGRRPSRRELVCGLGLAVAPFLTLLPQRVLAPHEHYPIPIVTAQITLLLTLFANARAVASPRVKVALTAAALTLFYVVGLVPAGFDQTLAKELECRPDARAVFTDLNARVAGGQRVYVDPYVPTSKRNPNVVSSWTTTVDQVAAAQVDALILNRPYFTRYFDDERAGYVEVYNPARAATREFYEIFRDRPEVVDDARLGSWHRTSVRCHWETWERARGIKK